MKYKVKTVLISNFDMGESISEGVYKNLCIAGCPEEWFEKIEPEVKEGQYWKWGKGVYRVGDVHSKRECFIKNIREDDEFSIPIEILKRDGSKLSNKEVAKAIIEEAKQRYDGKAIESINGRGHVSLGIKHLHYEYEADTLWLGAYKIYEQGQWAEIIEDKWEVYQDDIGIYVTNGDKTIRAVNGFPVKSLSDIEAEAIATALNELDNESR